MIAGHVVRRGAAQRAYLAGIMRQGLGAAAAFEHPPELFQAPAGAPAHAWSALWSSVRQARLGNFDASNADYQKAQDFGRGMSTQHLARWNEAVRERHRIVTELRGDPDQVAELQAEAAKEVQDTRRKAAEGSTEAAWAAERKDREETEWLKEGDTFSYAVSWLPGGHTLAKGKRASEKGLKGLLTPRRLIIGAAVLGVGGAGYVAIKSYAQAKARRR